MEYQELKNFGQLYTGKPSARVMMGAFTAIPSDLGILGTPKFLAKMQSQDRRWKKCRFHTAEERQLTNQDFVEGIQYSLAFYTSLVETCGEQKVSTFYPELTRKIAVMMWEDFLPGEKDLLHCENPWEALRAYMQKFFETWQGAGVCRYEIVQNTETDLQVHVTDCAWDAMHREHGHPNIIAISSDSELEVFPRLAKAAGGAFQNKGRICHGDRVCDWHFYRNHQE